MTHPRSRALLGVLAVVLTCLVGCGDGSGSGDEPGDAGASLVRVPQDQPTIQKGVDAAAEGGLVLVDPGVYHESVIVKQRDVTLRGTDRNTVIIDGEGSRPHGVVGIADGVRVQNLTVRNHTFYGVLVTGLHDENGPRANSPGGYETFDPEQFPPLQRFQIDHVTAADNGLYGIYAFNAQHGVIRDNYASGSADSGFYVGQCRECDILVTANVGERNAVGFENANASEPMMVTGNRFSSNRVGMTFLSDYQEAFIPQTGDVVAGNLVVDNNQEQTPSQADGGFGIGIGIAGGVENRVVRNRIEGNRRGGVVISHNSDLPALRNELQGNEYAGNGADFADISSAATPGVGNCPEPGASTLPAGLAGADCEAATTGPAADGSALEERAAEPAGVSFLDVPLPPDQPGLADVEAVPEPLPARVTMPTLDEIGVPPRSLFAELLWVAS